MIFLDKPMYKPEFLDKLNDDFLYMHYRKIRYSDYPNLRYIICPCTGVDYIDFEHCEKNNIKVIYLDDKDWLFENVWATAEHIVYLMLRTLKRSMSREWDYNSELRGKVVGIIGYGRIGRQIKKLLYVFGVDIRVYDNKFGSFPLNYLFETCDIITIHVPLTDYTRNLVTYNMWNKFKNKGGILINVSRQEIVEGFDGDFERVIFGKGVGYKEIKTPHMAGYTEESRTRTDEYVFNKLKGELCEQK